MFQFVLKHRKFSHLRHVANMTTAIDPNNKGNLKLGAEKLTFVVLLGKTIWMKQKNMNMN